MTLEEAIKHSEEVAEEHEELYRVCPASESDIFHCDGTNNCKTLKNGKNKGCLKYAEEHRQLAEWLKELKELREQTRWIPISERLPKFADVYRVTRYHPNNGMNLKYSVDVCCFDGSNWCDDNRFNPERPYVHNIIAWQENPEPYKVESQESEENKYQKMLEILENVWNIPSCMIDKAECLDKIMETYKSVRRQNE